MSTSNCQTDSESVNPPTRPIWPWTLTDDDFVILIERLEATGSPHLAARLGDIAHAIAQQQQPEVITVPVLIRA